jgi:hypothetical protein
MRSATEATVSSSKVYLICDRFDRVVVVGGVVEHKITYLGRRYTEIFEHCKDSLSYIVARMGAHKLWQGNR